MAVPCRKYLNLLFITTSKKAGSAETTLISWHEYFVILIRSLYFPDPIFPWYLFSFREA